MRHIAKLRSGTLTVATTHERVPLVSLLGFAARSNPKRGFYFVSKVLGRHIPIAPSVLTHHSAMLADLVEPDSGPYLVVGMGEAAVALGGAVAQQLGTRQPDVTFTFTTRQELPGEQVLCSFDEAHSHAPSHLLYRPAPEMTAEFHSARHLVLVDDEMTTGRTVTELAKKLARHLPYLRRVTVVSLVSWMKAERQFVLADDLPQVSLTFDALARGSSEFEFSAAFTPRLPERTDTEVGRFMPSATTGRLGLSVRDMDLASWPVPELSKDRPVLVLGTVEFSFQPYLLACKLEEMGHKVNILCTTRTPILPGHAIQNVITFDSVLGDTASPVHYLYNPPQGHQVVACYENSFQAENYGLRAHLPHIPWVMPALQEQAMEAA